MSSPPPNYTDTNGLLSLEGRTTGFGETEVPLQGGERSTTNRTTENFESSCRPPQSWVEDPQIPGPAGGIGTGESSEKDLDSSPTSPVNQELGPQGGSTDFDVLVDR